MEIILPLLKIAFSIAAGLLAGSSIIYTYNRIPAKWLCDYNQEPDRGMWGERIKRKPWFAVFVLIFTAASLKLLDQGILYTIAGIIALWLLLQIGMADMKYRIIPDQYVIALAVTALGFIPFHSSRLSSLYGLIAGGGCILFMGLIGWLIFKKESIGFGDIKLFAAIGLLSGLKGVIVILIISIFSSAIVFAAGLALRKIKYGEEQPLGPFISAAAALYILFSKELLMLVEIYTG
ncbi:MAG: A24 family peptidase [Eubacteriales bacterium]|nr:A24 family peptidase [Eubacteriales bacterium]